MTSISWSPKALNDAASCPSNSVISQIGGDRISLDYVYLNPALRLFRELRVFHLFRHTTCLALIRLPDFQPDPSPNLTYTTQSVGTSEYPRLLEDVGA